MKTFLYLTSMAFAMATTINAEPSLEAVHAELTSGKATVKADTPKNQAPPAAAATPTAAPVSIPEVEPEVSKTAEMIREESTAVLKVAVEKSQQAQQAHPKKELGESFEETVARNAERFPKARVASKPASPPAPVPVPKAEAVPTTAAAVAPVPAALKPALPALPSYKVNTMLKFLSESRQDIKTAGASDKSTELLQKLERRLEVMEDELAPYKQPPATTPAGALKDSEVDDGSDDEFNMDGEPEETQVTSANQD